MSISAWKVLGPIDSKSVVRDPLLRWLTLYPLAIAAIVRWGIPAVEPRLQRQFGLELAPYYPLLLSFLALMTPMLAGMVVGFLLLDQQDDGTLTALRVTPMTLREYLSYRMAAPVLLSFLIGLLVLPTVGLVRLSVLQVVVCSFAAAPLAPLYALALATLASNKVQGFAWAKAFGVFTVPPVIAYFIQEPWQWLFGIVPLYWTSKVVWETIPGSPFMPLYLGIGFAYQSFLLALLVRHFRKQLGRIG